MAKKTKIFSFLFLFLFLVQVLSLISISVIPVKEVRASTGTEMFSATNDTYISAVTGETGNNYGSDILLYSGYSTNWRDALFLFNRTYMKQLFLMGIFDDYVYLRLYLYLAQYQPVKTLPMSVYRIVSEWNESDVTWDTKPTWNSANCSYKLVNTSYCGQGGAGYVYFDIRDDLLNILVNDGQPFYGYMVTGYNPYQFAYIDAIEKAGDNEAVIIYGYDEEIGEEEEEGNLFATNQGTNLMLLFMMLFVPSFMLMAGTREYVAPHISFLVGFGIMTGITHLTMPSLMPLWLLFVIVLALAILLFAIFKRQIF